MTRIGIFGGSFDPIHLGHLILAEQAREQLGLRKVLFIPAHMPPHKQSRAMTDGKSRMAMIEMAVAGNPAFAACDVELRRGGVSYTIDTLKAIQEEHPADELVLLLGADMVADIPNWREPGEIVRTAIIAAAERPGSGKTFTSPSPAARLERIEMPAVEISSTEIRARIAAGRSVRYFVPASVDAFIQAHCLYSQ